MIYTVIADTEDFRKFSEELKKRDCRNTWQPLNLIPDDVFTYINDAKNDEVRLERLASYSTLFFALCKLYGKRNLTLSRTELGKPYLMENNERSRIHVSISHTDGAIAISLSDECDIGVDIQSEINTERIEKLEERFLYNINIKEEKIDERVLLLKTKGDTAIFLDAEFSNPSNIDFTLKWAYCESILKCDGCGFNGLKKISEIQSKTKSSIKKITINKRKFSLVTTIKVL